MRQHILRLVIVAVVMASALPAQAQETDPKMKSVGLAWVLGLDPLPSDALYYAGKSTQGTINLLLGVPSAIGFYLGLATYVSGRSDTEDDFSDADIGRAIMIVSAIPYFACLLWDGIGGIHGVVKHNADIEKKRKTSWLSTVRPTLAVTPGGAFAGAQFTF